MDRPIGVDLLLALTLGMIVMIFDRLHMASLFVFLAQGVIHDT